MKIKKVLAELDENDLKQIEETGTFVIPDGIDEIEDVVFMLAGTRTKLREIVVPESVQYIGDLAFCGCEIEELTFKGNPQMAETAFKDCEVNLIITNPKISKKERSGLLTKFTDTGGDYNYSYPEGNALITLIKTGVYTIPENIDVIERSAFQGADVLEKLIVSANTRMIEEFAFVDCPNLKEIVFEGAPKIGKFAFSKAVERVVISGTINPQDREKLIKELTEDFDYYNKKVEFIIVDGKENEDESEAE